MVGHGTGVLRGYGEGGVGSDRGLVVCLFRVCFSFGWTNGTIRLEGVVSGLTGGLLSESLLEPLYLACLLIPCTSLFPDASSALLALSIVKKFVPSLEEVEETKLRERAKETEDAVLGLVKALQGGLQKEMAAPRGLYG